jgi:hypothetical protein
VRPRELTPEADADRGAAAEERREPAPPEPLLVAAHPLAAEREAVLDRAIAREHPQRSRPSAGRSRAGHSSSSCRSRSTFTSFTATARSAHAACGSASHCR